MPTIATWNVNSVNARLPNVLAWLARGQARHRAAAGDQVRRRGVPAPRPSGELGYNVADPRPEELQRRRDPEPARRSRTSVRGLPGEPADEQARYLEATVGGLRVASIYLPNGNPIGTDKFAYKLRLDGAAARRMPQRLLEHDEPLVLGGDYNVIPEPIDCHDPRAWQGDALFQPGEPPGLPRAPPPRLHRGLPRAAPRRARRLQLLGLPAAAPSSSTTASASTICCSRRRPPTASRPPAPSTRTRAGSPRHRTTRRCWCD